MRSILPLALAILSQVPVAAFAAPLPSGTELLERSIRYHDPAGAWGRKVLRLLLEESRPDGGVRETALTIDIAGEAFEWNSKRDDHDVGGRLSGAECEVTLDGDAEFSAEDAEEYRLSCERVAWFRDYYTYLYGLPMKLLDAGTLLDESVTETEFDSRKVLALRVTYDQEVGADTWYFYFDPSTAALAGYRFYHDESKDDGEYITLEGEVVLGGMKLPRVRAWYFNDGRGYLGTDTLVGNRSTAE